LDVCDLPSSSESSRIAAFIRACIVLRDA
jgi:hypothetical protein